MESKSTNVNSKINHCTYVHVYLLPLGIKHVVR
jgi:hypothetical protein